jgi:hypothetical protein
MLVKKGQCVTAMGVCYIATEDARTQQTIDPPPPTPEEGGIPGWGMVHGFKAIREGDLDLPGFGDIVFVGTSTIDEVING